jgi:hypothetical protein
MEMSAKLPGGELQLRADPRLRGEAKRGPHPAAREARPARGLDRVALVLGEGSRNGIALAENLVKTAR